MKPTSSDYTPSPDSLLAMRARTSLNCYPRILGQNLQNPPSSHTPGGGLTKEKLMAIIDSALDIINDSLEDSEGSGDSSTRPSN